MDIPAEVLNSLNENHSNHAVKHTVSLQVDFTLKLQPHSQISVIPNIELLSTSVKSLNQPETTVNREGERTRNNLLISQPLSVMTTPIRQVPPISKEVPSPTNWVPPLANGETKKEKNIFVISRPPGSDTGRDNTIGELANLQSVESCNNGHKNIKDTAVENFPLFPVINPDKIHTSDEVNLPPANPTDSSCVLTSQVDDTATDTSGVILKIAGNNKTRESRYADQQDWGQLELNQGPQNTQTFPHNSVLNIQLNLMDTIWRLMKTMQRTYNLIGGPLLLMLILLMTIPGFNADTISHMNQTCLNLQPSLMTLSTLPTFMRIL